MGKTSRPLTIFLTDPEMLQWPEVQALVLQQHRVVTWTDVQQEHDSLSVGDIDVVLGPNCWRMDERLRRYFKTALDAARRVKYPTP